MSMIGNFYLVTDESLRSALSDPSSIHDILEAAYDAGERFIDIDKTWHCLHFLLTGSDWEGEAPLNFIASGGQSVGDEDVGYGPARAFSSAEVTALAEAVADIDAAELARRFDGEAMDRLQIYPFSDEWAELDPTDNDAFGYFTGAFDSLKALISRGQRAGYGMLVWLN